MNKIMYTNNEGVHVLVVPALKSDLEKLFGAMTEQEYSDHVYGRAVPQDATNVKEVTDQDLPDSYFFKAWSNNASDVTIDMAKARDVHMANIRRVRDAELAKLDVETLKGNDVQAQKQVLRDIPQTFDLTGAATPAALKALWPTELPAQA